MSADDRLSGLLDGELDAEEVRLLEADLVADPARRDELEAAAQARALVRDLEPVDPPAGFELVPAGARDEPAAEVIPLTRRRRPWVLAVAAVTILFLVLGFASGTRVTDVVPPVDDLVDQHAAAAEAMPDEVIDGPFAVMPMDEMSDMGPAMPEMPMVAAYQSGDITHFLYDSAHGPVSVFRQDGRLDTAALPGSESVPMAVGTAMVMSDDKSDVVLVERDDVVFTVIGANSNHDMVMGTAEAVPASDRGVVDRIRRWFGRLG